MNQSELDDEESGSDVDSLSVEAFSDVPPCLEVDVDFVDVDDVDDDFSDSDSDSDSDSVVDLDDGFFGGS